METMLERIVAPAWLIVGLSHALHPRLTADFFGAIQRSGVAGLIIGFYTLPLGLLLVVCHPVWVWDWPVLITISGWAMTIKSVVYLLVPSTADRMLSRAVPRGERFRAVGLAMVVMGSVLTLDAYGLGI